MIPRNQQEEDTARKMNTKALKLKTHKVAKMCMGPVDTTHTKELAKLMSIMIPLQRLKIRDDGMPANNPDKSETDASAPPQN